MNRKATEANGIDLSGTLIIMDFRAIKNSQLKTTGNYRKIEMNLFNHVTEFRKC